MLRLVPFNATWINHDKIDLHAIYERPRFKENKYGEHEREYDEAGLQTWDLTGPLPVKQHNKWIAKGFRYVTLANRESLLTAARNGTLIGGSVRDYDQHQTGGPWNYRKYAEGLTLGREADLEKLRADVLRFGPDAAEEIRRQSDPGFTLPDSLRHLKADEKPPSPRKSGAAA